MWYFTTDSIKALQRNYPGSEIFIFKIKCDRIYHPKLSAMSIKVNKTNLLLSELMSMK